MSVSDSEKLESTMSDDTKVEESEAEDTKTMRPSESAVDENGIADAGKSYITGKRFYLLFIGLDLATFLVQLEMTIVATASLAMANDLNDFKHSTWVVNAYFLTWSAFMVIWSQLGATIGRKTSLLTSLGLFILASAACAASQTSTQLYGFRGVQGLGGGGVFTLTYSISSEAVPLPTFLNVMRVLAVLSVVSSATGPLIGGAIVSKTTWRWIFILNIPLALIAFVIILVALPNGFPHHKKPTSQQQTFALSSLKRFDALGALLFVCTIAWTIVTLQEVAVTFPWNSPITICLLTLSGLCIIAFGFWERFITYSSKLSITPVLTYRFATRRIMAMLANSALIGVPFLFALVQLTQRFQVLDVLSPLRASINLLPFVAVISVGAIMGTVLGRKYLGTPVYGQLIGVMLQLAATICFTVFPLRFSPSRHIPASQYGFQVLLGLGSGISYITNVTGLQHFLYRQPDLMLAGSGAVMQFRYIGAAIGLASFTAAFNTYVRGGLSSFLEPDQISSVLQSSQMISTLNVADQARVVDVFAQAFDLQWKIVCGAVGLQIVTSLLTY